MTHAQLPGGALALLLVVCGFSFAQTADLARVRSDIESRLGLAPGRLVALTATTVSPEGRELIFAGLSEGEEAPGQVLVFERDGQGQLWRVDQSPGRPGVQPLELRDGSGQPLATPHAISVEQEADGSVWLCIPHSVRDESVTRLRVEVRPQGAD